MYEKIILEESIVGVLYNARQISILCNKKGYIDKEIFLCSFVSNDQMLERITEAGKQYEYIRVLSNVRGFVELEIKRRKFFNKQFESFKYNILANNISNKKSFKMKNVSKDTIELLEDINERLQQLGVKCPYLTYDIMLEYFEKTNNKAYARFVL